MVTLCKLDFHKYSLAPHENPMFKSLVAASNCNPTTTLTSSISDIKDKLLRNNGSKSGRIVYPTAFIFHESRVGSTLLCNLLATNPYHLVFSESSPPASILLSSCGGGLEGIGAERCMARLLQVMTLMGHSTYHTHLFFKFQSITATKMSIVLKVAPCESSSPFSHTILSFSLLFSFMHALCTSILLRSCPCDTGVP